MLVFSLLVSNLVALYMAMSNNVMPDQHSRVCRRPNKDPQQSLPPWSEIQPRAARVNSREENFGQG